MTAKQRISNSTLITLIILENLFLYVFFRNGILTQGKNAIGLFVTSVLFGLVVIYKFYNAKVSYSPTPVTGKKITKVMVGLLILGLVVLGWQYDVFFRAHPVTNTSSDIIPSIEIMCKRLLKNQYPYAVFNDFGFAQMPTYLPMQWMPFTIAELTHIDYRWIPYAAWSAAAVLLCVRSAKISSPVLRAAVPLMIFASNYVLFSFNRGIVEVTVEVLISAYYMVLISGLNQTSGILQGLIISCCLLSRYSLVLWLPLYCFILFFTQNRRQLYISLSTTFIVVTVLYVIPFMSKDIHIFYKSYKYYDDSAFFEWTHMSRDGHPIQLFSGTGFAYFFYTRFTGLEVMARVKLLQRTHLICSILSTVIMGFWFWFKKDKINSRIFTLASFKIYLSVFLFLIQVPYEYLMLVGNFVSVAIFCEQARYQLTGKKLIPAEG